MSFVRSTSSVLSIVLAAGLLLAGPVSAAGQPAPKLSGQKARVGQGVRVDLAASSLTAAELASLRPEYERLKPRARTSAE